MVKPQNTGLLSVIEDFPHVHGPVGEYSDTHTSSIGMFSEEYC